MRLTKKYAESIDGVELGDRHVGDVLDLPPEKGRLLVGEAWAIPERRGEDRPGSPTPRRRADDEQNGRTEGDPRERD